VAGVLQRGQRDQDGVATVDVMCGRFVATSPPDELAAYFGATAAPEAALAPNYNVAPTQDVLAVVEHDGERHLDAFHWGLIPSWAKDARIGSRMINARAETLAEKSAFKKPFATRRCLVPADGFYEWKKLTSGAKPKKQPMFIRRADGLPLAFAGLWSVWRGPDRGDEPLRSLTIVTTSPNAVMAPVHDRMPAILAEDRWATWLDRGNDDVAALGRLLVPAPDDLLTLTPVSTLVNSVRNNGPELLEPDAEQGTLL
jgi:putative SOS response-associated peptidase YedK